MLKHTITHLQNFCLKDFTAYRYTSPFFNFSMILRVIFDGFHPA